MADRVYNYTCFPSPNTVLDQINVYDRGFPAQFLITAFWSDYPALQTTLYVFASIQLVLALLGIFIGLGRHVDKEEHGLSDYLNRKVLTVLTSFWQLALSGLVLFLPTQWLSNVTMGMILYHAWAEYFALVLRFMIITQRPNITQRSLNMFYKWSMIIVAVTGIPFMLGSNPYIQGLISTVLVFPADFLNLFVAPILTAYWLKQNPHSGPAEKTAEILRGTLSPIHVIWFYGQGLLACLVSVEVGAQFFIAFQVISTVIFAGVITAYGCTIKNVKEWDEPVKQFRLLFDCYYQPHPGDEEGESKKPPPSYGTTVSLVVKQDGDL